MMNRPKGYVSPMERAKDPAVRRRIDEKKREIYLGQGRRLSVAQENSPKSRA